MKILLKDEQEFTDCNRVLIAECGLYENRIRATGKEFPARPAAASGEDIVAMNAALTAHVAQLKTLAGETSPNTQKSEAAEQKTLTERVIASKGAKDLASLPVRNGALD